jgi:hypothetical protein
MRINVFQGKDQIGVCHIEAKVGMRIKQGVIKRITKSFVWVESTIWQFQKTGRPIAQPTMTLTQAKPYLQWEVEQQEESGRWSYVNHAFTERAAKRLAARYQGKSGETCRVVPRDREGK